MKTADLAAEYIAQLEKRIAELQADQFKTEWVSVEDRLPEDGELCDIVIYWPKEKRQDKREAYIFKTDRPLVTDWKNYFQEYAFHLNGLYDMAFMINEGLVTHYRKHMPLPPPPTK